MSLLGLALVFVAGIILGLTGSGGSILLIPILSTFLGFSWKAAVSMTLLIQFITGMTAALARGKSHRQFPVDKKLVIRCSLIGMAFAWVGGKVSYMINDTLLTIFFAITLFVIAAGMFRSKVTESDEHCSLKVPPIKTALSGAGTGFLTGLLGVGGGFLLVPCLHLICKIPVVPAVTAALWIVSLNSFAGFMAHLSTVPTNWTLIAIPFGVNILGALAGYKLHPYIPDAIMKKAMAIFLLATGIALLLK